jgi:hypothetical protein
MQRLRRTTVNIVVVLLLSWTVADLCLPALCAAESTELFDSGDVSKMPTLQPDRTTPVRAPAQSDDCFCCSHAVDIRALSFSANPSGEVSVGSQYVSGIPSAPPSALYHPPQL